MNRLLLVIGALFVGALLWFCAGRSSERGPASAAHPLAELPSEAAFELEEVVSPPTQRNALPATKAAPSTNAVSDGPQAAESLGISRVRVVGRVLDPMGQGLSGVSVVEAGESGAGEALALSGPDGRFEAELDLAQEPRLESSSDSGFATLRAAQVTTQNARLEQIIVAARAIDLAGTVVESEGPPLAGVRLSLSVPVSGFVGFPRPLDGTLSASIETLTEEDGRFRLARVPFMAGAAIAVRHAGHQTTQFEVPEEDASGLWIEMKPRNEKEAWLTGIVVLPDGSAAVGAQVCLDSNRVEAAEDGRFEMEKGWADPEAPLVAALPGHQPAVLPSSGGLMKEELPPLPIRLVLGGPPLSIRGRILGARGEPSPGWRVDLFDGTQVSRNQVPMLLAEDLTRGEEGARESDAAGEFELSGLLERAYIVQAYDPETLLRLHSEPIAAGTQDLVLRIPEEAYLPSLTGEVVGRDGTPIAGALVAARLVIAESGGALQYEDTTGATTAEDGRFLLERVPRQGVTLHVDGESVIPREFELGELDLDGALLEVARRCHFRIELASSGAAGAGGEPEGPDAIHVLNGQGAALSVYTFQGRGWSSSSRVRLSRLGTHPLGVSEDARTVVFFRGEDELRRVPVLLSSGEVTVVHSDD